MTWLLTIEARDPENRPCVLRFSDGAYDAPDDTLYLPRIKQPGLYQSGLYAGEVVSVERSGVGETTLINADGGLNYLADYAVDGRAVVLSLATDAGVREILRGTASGLSYTRNEVTLQLRDPQALIKRPHPHQTYAGTNSLPHGLEGTKDDIQGQPKPRVYGDIRNAKPVLVNTSLLIYQIGSRADCTIDAVYDNGAPIDAGAPYASIADLQATAPAAGESRRYQGFVRLGSSPVGTLTCDARTARVQLGDVIAMLCDEVAIPCDVAALANVGAVGLYVTDASDTASLLDRLVAAGAWWRIDAGGVIRAAMLVMPDSAPTPIHDHEIVSIDRKATGAGDVGLPVWRVTVRADRLETTLSDTAGSVDDDRRARLGREYRDAIAERPDVLERHPLAGELTITSTLRDLDDAQALAESILDLVSVRRDRVTIEGRITRHRLEIGAGVEIITPRLGYAAGRRVIVIGQQINARNGRLTLELWG
ncbi:hypothetical protein BTW08_15930 [Salinicola sp. MH3R3-1]|uniref:hypothetical protein n=1 Tax=Salinicola sp. MH3R3-1 TaxID=1928762 RepID=UPI00094F2424|nr:hypothetical protein [Salinicola sp. MH3R3-1]OLO06645.1 hypothetical protein BTW08_15930 [Salinicola sp. MH3R3-1]